jgi:hypothetical protein
MSYVDPPAAKIDYEAWNAAFGRAPDPFPALGGATEPRPGYLATPRCFVELEGDSRLRSLRFDNSLAALRLWSFLLSENDRLAAARRSGRKIIGVLKDLGTAPLIAYARPACRSRRAWDLAPWRCPRDCEIADAGLATRFPVRRPAAFLNRAHFPSPICRRRGACWTTCLPDAAPGGSDVPVWGPSIAGRGRPGGRRAVAGQPDRVRRAVRRPGRPRRHDDMISSSSSANRIRSLRRIRDLAHGVVPAPFPPSKHRSSRCWPSICPTSRSAPRSRACRFDWKRRDGEVLAPTPAGCLGHPAADLRS